MIECKHIADIGQDCARGGQGGGAQRCVESWALPSALQVPPHRSCSSSGPQNKRNKSKEAHRYSHGGRAAGHGLGEPRMQPDSLASAERAAGSWAEPGRILRGSQQGSCAATPQAACGIAAHYAGGRGPAGSRGSTGCACPVRCSKFPSCRPVGGEARREQPGARGKEAGRLGSEPSRRRCPLPGQPPWKVAPLNPFYC